MLGRRSPHRRSRTGLWFAAFTILSLLMLLASGTGQAQALRQAVAGALEPPRALVAGVGQGVADLFGAIGEIDRLRTENKRLEGEQISLQQRVAELEEAAHENEELRRLLGIVEHLEMDLLVARVVARDASNFGWEIGIDRGSDDGLAPGMPVVASAQLAGGDEPESVGGLAGTVTEVGPDSARIRLVVDTRSNVVALDQQTRALGVVQGQPGGQLVMVQVRAIDPVERGDAILSAGLRLGQGLASGYPGGLLIGFVEAVETDPNALTKTVFVRPAIDFSRIERVLVVLDFAQG